MACVDHNFVGWEGGREKGRERERERGREREREGGEGRETYLEYFDDTFCIIGHINCLEDFAVLPSP